VGAAVTLNLILIALAVTLDPLPLTAFMVVLAAKRGVLKGAAYVFGWLVSLAIVVAITVLATGNNPPKPATVPSIAALAVKIAIGAWLVWIAIRRRRKMGQPKEPKKPPKWQASVDSMSPWFVMALAPTLQPWVLVGAGAATVVEAKLSTPASFLALFFYCVVASSSYLGMEIYASIRPQQSRALLARIQAWISDHSDQVIIWGSLLLGLWLIANSLYIVLD
jgi:threonine/homoserine/homoserine lactone efflux protein